MALKKDGNSRSSASFMPYNASDSFIKKMTGRVTGLIGWNTSSQSVVSQNHDDLSSSTDEDNISPTPKRMRVQSEPEDTLLSFIPNASKAINEACSPIQPVNDINPAEPNQRNACLVSSTPASARSSTYKSILTPAKTGTTHQSHNSDVTDHPERKESFNYSLTIPQYDAHQRHNVTVPSISKDVPSQISNFDSSKLSGSFLATNSRRPSFNVDVFSTSNKQLSSTVCESRNMTLSPFYAARTMYGGASALLPYGSQQLSRMRSASTSKLNLFSPRSSQITIQPVPSPNKFNDQETMSATARRILDTLEKYCSPVMDAKRIPINESSKKAVVSDTSTTGASRGVKRKLPALNQLMPSTTDLLRIKRKEEIQDSVSSARQIVSTVPESSFAVDHNSDSSSDSADLDYSILKEGTKNISNQKYIGRIRRKDEKKIDDRPLTPIELPNAVLKISNLPKFDITDTFTFSKPLLLENLEQNAAEETTAANDNIVKEDRNSSATLKQASSSTATDSKSVKNANTQISDEVSKKPITGMSSWNFSCSVQNQQLKASTPPTASTKASPPKKTVPWTCKVCHMENTSQSCSSCSSSREVNIKPKEPLKPIQKETVSAPCKPLSDSNKGFKVSTELSAKSANNTSQSGAEDPWKSFKKAASNTWKCDECWVQNQLSDAICLSCSSARKTNSADVTHSSSMPVMTVSGGAKKSGAVSTAFSEKGEIKNMESTLFKTSTSTSLVTGTTDVKPPTFTFGINNTTSAAFGSAANASSGDNTPKPVPPPIYSSFSFGNPSPATTTKSTPTTTAPFSFSIKNLPNQTEVTGCNVFGSKPSFADSTATTPIKATDKETFAVDHKDITTFSDSSKTKNPLLKSTSETTNKESDLSIIPKFEIPKNTTSSKENGEEATSNSVFSNDTGCATSNESPLKKKSVMFPTFNAVNVPNIFGANGLSKSEAGSVPSSSTDTNNTTASVSVTGSPGNIFTTTLSQSPASKPLINNVQTPLFAAATNKLETAITASDSSKNSSLFSNATSSFGVSSSQPSSMFGGFVAGDVEFASKKTDLQQVTSSSCSSNSSVAFNPTTPTFTFGSNASASLAAAAVTSSSSVPASTLPSGGFTFNGPKAEGNGPQNFVFGAVANTNENTNNNGGSTFGCVTPQSRFTFNTQPSTSIPFANDSQQHQQATMNSLFASPAIKAQPDLQQTSNSISVFGNNLFSAGHQQQQQQQPTMNAIKKSGGFSFPAVNQFDTQSMNSFSNFATPPTENQDQSRMNSGAAPASSTFVFGAQNQTAHNFNLTVPSTFNFNSGNALSSFTAQSSSATGGTTTVPRRIKKAVRRTMK